MPKTPTAKEFLTDPKYAEQKGFFKELMTGIAEEVQTETRAKKGKKTTETNLFDSLFGGSDDNDNE